MVTCMSKCPKILVLVILSLVALASVGCIENPDQFTSSSDTSLDADEPDADADDPKDISITCDEPDADEICTTYETDCGPLSVIDACGDFHQLDCGSCQDGVCLEGGCFPPGCDDGIQNQDETDIDCGGELCPPCADGKSCDDDADCLSGVCTGNECARPTCDDGVLNQGETDTDCGGPNCDPCPLGARCHVDSDCLQGLCIDERCTAHSTDGLQALYTFDEGQGEVVYDRSALDPPLDLSFVGDEGTVEWGEDCNCVEFSGGMLRHELPWRLYGSTVVPPVQFSVEMWIQTDQTSQSGPARLFNLSDGWWTRNLQIGHDSQDLKVRVRHDGNLEGHPFARFTDIFDGSDLIHLVLVFEQTEIRVYKNGDYFGTDSQNRAETIWQWDGNYPLLLGNEVSMDRAWYGVMHFVAFYNRALSAEEIAIHHQVGHEIEY